LGDRDVFDRRLDRLEQLIRRLRQLAGGERETFLREHELQAQAERWLHLAAQCVLDLAHHLIADRGWRTPSTYRDAFAVLHEQGVLAAELSSRMEGWAGLRNVLVHLYLEVDHEILFDILQNDLDELVSYAQAVQRFTSK
jgi:uncharacterized protein YutE (UPF0331/DUF86 family)